MHHWTSEKIKTRLNKNIIIDVGCFFKTYRDGNEFEIKIINIQNEQKLFYLHYYSFQSLNISSRQNCNLCFWYRMFSRTKDILADFYTQSVKIHLNSLIWTFPCCKSTETEPRSFSNFSQLVTCKKNFFRFWQTKVAKKGCNVFFHDWNLQVLEKVTVEVFRFGNVQSREELII